MIENTISIPKGTKLQSDVSIVDIIGNFIIWIILTIVTLGLAMFVYFYYYNRFVINNTFVVDRDGKEIGKLKCELSVGQAIGHCILWMLLIIVTLGFLSVGQAIGHSIIWMLLTIVALGLGFGLFLYFYKIIAFILNKTEIEIFDV